MGVVKFEVRTEEWPDYGKLMNGVKGWASISLNNGSVFGPVHLVVGLHLAIGP